MTNDLRVFLNPNAGRGAEAESEALRLAFEATGRTVFVEAVPGNEVEQRVKQALAEGSRLIGAAGGDGTISATANALTGTAATLLPIPMGTLNHFSRRYGITSVEDAVAALQRNQPVHIHTGCVNDRIFVNNASCGFYPHVVRHRDAMERWLPRVPAMWLAGMRVLLALPMMRLRADMDGRVEHIRTPALWVGIGRNSLRLPETGDAAVSAPVLEIVTGRAASRRSVIALAGRLAWHLKKGLGPQAADLDVWRAPEFSLEASHGIDIALDGEAYRMRSPLTFRIREEELCVLSLASPD